MAPKLAAAVIAVLLPALGAAQESESAKTSAEQGARARFKTLVELQQQEESRPVRGYYEALAKEEPAPGRRSSVAAATDALDTDSNAAATVRRLAGAIRTKPDGTDAGLVVAPFLLFDSRTLRGFEVTFAALKNDVTRFGGSYTWDATPLPDASDVKLPHCPREQLDTEVEKFFVAACSAVIPHVVSKRDGDLNDRARAACGLPAKTSMVGLGNSVRQVAQAVSAVRADATLGPEQQLAILRLAEQAANLSEWNFGHPFACYEGGLDAEVFFKRALWAIPKKRFAVSAVADYLPRKYGFSPDGAKLPRGQRSSWQVRADFSRSASGFEVGFGMGYGGSRANSEEEFAEILTPSFSVAGTLTALSGTPLTRRGLLNTNDKGDVPPHVVLGLTAATEIALDRPELQTTNLNEVTIQPYLDFFINDKLSFRLGVPIKGSLVERKAQDAKDPVPPATVGTPAVPGQRSLQWTVPVALVTVLNL